MITKEAEDAKPRILGCFMPVSNCGKLACHPDDRRPALVHKRMSGFFVYLDIVGNAGCFEDGPQAFSLAAEG